VWQRWPAGTAPECSKKDMKHKMRRQGLALQNKSGFGKESGELLLLRSHKMMVYAVFKTCN
jgi:hypothetical protein